MHQLITILGFQTLCAHMSTQAVFLNLSLNLRSLLTALQNQCENTSSPKMLLM